MMDYKLGQVVILGELAPDHIKREQWDIDGRRMPDYNGLGVVKWITGDQITVMPCYGRREWAASQWFGHPVKVSRHQLEYNAT